MSETFSLCSGTVTCQGSFIYRKSCISELQKELSLKVFGADFRQGGSCLYLSVGAAYLLADGNKWFEWWEM